MVRIHENCYFDIKKSQHYFIFGKNSKCLGQFLLICIFEYMKDSFIWFQINQNCTQKIMKLGLVKKSLIFTSRKAFIVEEKQVMTFKLRMNETIQ